MRWARLLRTLGHRVSIRQVYHGGRYDMMVALHARRSAAAIHRFVREHAGRPVVVALTGTDLYHDIRTSRSAQKSLDLATRLIILQPNGIQELPTSVRAKTRVILQSAVPIRVKQSYAGHDGSFQICVLGHLRSEKDPLRAALAARMLGTKSRIRIVHAGAALDIALGRRAAAESTRSDRYRWIGEVPYARARRILESSDLLVLSSRLEGGANVLSEAIVESVPIVASDIPSTRGILGSDYPGLYPVGNTQRLAELLDRVENDAEFYRQLKDWCTRLRPRFRSDEERASLGRLIAELFAKKRKHKKRR
jgi:putative glycosyltransferase (TIGR04348 family)